VAGVDFSRLELPPDRRQLALDDLLDRLGAVPGVRAAASDVVPVSGQWNNTRVEVDGPTGVESGSVDLALVTPGYFRTMETPLYQGRDFGPEDRAATVPVAIVNQAFAGRFFAGRSPIGRTVRLPGSAGDRATTFQVVGLVANTKYESLRESFQPLVFFSVGERGVGRTIGLFVRGTESMSTLIPTVRRVVEAVNPRIDLQLSPLRVAVREGLLQDRLLASLSGFFGLLAATLAAIGLYGVMSYLVARRTNEMGIRIALGADQRTIVGMVLIESLRLVAIGLAVGTVVAAGAGGLAGSMLYGLSPRDPFAFAIAIGSLVAVGLVVVYLPARRAALVDPIEALRSD
jgi:predicted permease